MGAFGFAGPGTRKGDFLILPEGEAGGKSIPGSREGGRTARGDGLQGLADRKGGRT